MRFYARTIFAWLSLATASVSPPAGAAPETPPLAAPTETAPYVCPATQVFAARDGKTYVATFGKNAPWSGIITISFLTSTATYSVQLPISATKQVAPSDYRSSPIALTNPSDEKVEDVKVDFGEKDDVAECIDYFHLPDDLWTNPDAKKTIAELYHAQPPVSPVKVTGESDALTCKQPYRSSAIDGNAAELIYPVGAQRVGAMGRVWVKVRLTEDGTVAQATVYRSSGNYYLDASALSTASKTRYSPQIFRCEPVATYYLFVANFEP
jgi:TonB family protein